MIEMSELTATSEQILQYDAGPLVAVAFFGKYPPGSDGNQCAAEMITYLRSVLNATAAAAILFDFRALDYTWGDAIGGLAWALRVDAATFLPSAIVATGPTARALEPLLGPKFIFGIAGTKMFGSMPEAVGYLEHVLRIQTG
jgi:hypothetical protein